MNIFNLFKKKPKPKTIVLTEELKNKLEDFRKIFLSIRRIPCSPQNVIDNVKIIFDDAVILVPTDFTGYSMNCIFTWREYKITVSFICDFETWVAYEMTVRIRNKEDNK